VYLIVYWFIEPATYTVIGVYSEETDRRGGVIYMCTHFLFVTLKGWEHLGSVERKHWNGYFIEFQSDSMYNSKIMVQFVHYNMFWKLFLAVIIQSYTVHLKFLFPPLLQWLKLTIRRRTSSVMNLNKYCKLYKLLPQFSVLFMM
jgi:hypothetical protein